MTRSAVVWMLGLAGVIVVAAAGVTAADESLGNLTVDPRTGVATWSDTITCDPGDDVEIDVYIQQGSTQAFADAFFVCDSGSEHVVIRTSTDRDSDRLRPGPAQLTVDRIDYTPGDELATKEQHLYGQVKLRVMIT